MSERSLEPKRTSPKASFLWGAGAGVLIWMLSPVISGDAEPFDSWGYYIPALCLSGLALGFLRNRDWPLVGVGIIAGQILAAFLSPASWQPGSMMPVGVIFIVVCGAVPLLFAAAGAAAAKSIRPPVTGPGDSADR